MLTRKQLKSVHNEDLPLHIFEQDYIQAVFLKELYRISEDLVFKGGTYLKHAHGLDRFSEDLDFTQTSNGTKKELDEAAQRLGNYGIQAEVNNWKETDNSLTARLHYQGPLYDGSERSKGNIDLEISKRDDILLEPDWKRLFFPYPETRTVICLGMKLEETMAEKLRALSMRNKPRDLYDIWYLLKQNVNVDRELYRKKMKSVGVNPGFRLDLDERTWKGDLKILLQRPPRFEDVISEVKKILEKEEILKE